MNGCIFDKVNCLFECFLCCPDISVCWQLFRRLGGVVLFYGLYFHVKGVDVFHIIRFDLVNFLFNFFSGSNLVASILPPTLLLTLVFLILSSNNVESLERTFSCSICFDENLFVVSFKTFVSSERLSVSDFGLTSSFPILIYYSCCFPPNSFNYSYCFKY